ncbi:Uncharacterized membrane protein [Oceanospirillum multiglobuliferum]|nr:Uncharacterized membrane protein [Oceanospirillum multiglobuliferum]
MNRIEAGKDIASLAAKGRFWVLFSYIGMLVLLTGNSILFPTEGARTWVIVAFQTLPLLLFIPGVWLRRPRSHAWLCFVSLLYFTQGVTQAFIPSHAIFGLALSVLSSILFLAAMMFSRWESLRLKALQISSAPIAEQNKTESQTDAEQKNA